MSRQAWAGGSAWPGCLHAWVLPPSPGAACCYPGMGSTHSWLGTPHGFPSLAPFSSCHLCEQQAPCPVGRERISGKGALTLPLSSGGQPWRGAGRASQAQTTGVPVLAPGPTLAFSVEPCKTLDWRRQCWTLAGGLALGLCPDLLLSHPAQGQDLGAEVWLCFQVCRYGQ